MTRREWWLLIKASPIAMTVIAIFYPPAWLWVGTAAALAVAIVYPAELQAAVAAALAELPGYVRQAAAVITNPPDALVFFVVFAVCLGLLAPVFFIALLLTHDELTADHLLTEDDP